MSLQGNCAKNVLSGLIDVGTSSLLGGKARNAVSLLGNAFSFFSDKCKKDNILNLMGLNTSADPLDALQRCQIESSEGSLLSGLTNSPLIQMGEDFLAEELRKGSGALLQKVISNPLVTKFTDQVRNIESVAFNMVSLVMNIQTDVMISLIGGVAEQLLVILAQKRDLLDSMISDTRDLHNAIRLLVSRPFHDELRADMLSAYDALTDARDDFEIVRANLERNRGFLTRTYNAGYTELETASKILAPETDPNDPFSNAITNNGNLLEGFIGSISKSTQFSAMSTVWNKSNKVFNGLGSYSTYTDRINLMLSNYVNAVRILMNIMNRGYAKQIRSFYAKQLEASIEDIDEVRGELVEALSQGDDPNKIGDSSLTLSANSLKWMTKVNVILEFLKAVQPNIAGTLDPSTNMKYYLESVNLIREIETKTALGGAVILSCPQGKEDPSDLIAQQTAMFVQAKRAIVDAKVADNIVTISTVLIKRMELARSLVVELENDIRVFTDNIEDHPARNALYNVLEGMGMDNAAQTLRSGNFEGFFSMNPLTASFTGAALTCLAEAMECVDSAELQGEMDDLRLELERDKVNQRLEANRYLNNGRDRLRNDLLDKLSKCNEIQKRADDISQKADCDKFDPNTFDNFQSAPPLREGDAVPSSAEFEARFGDFTNPAVPIQLETQDFVILTDLMNGVQPQDILDNEKLIVFEDKTSEYLRANDDVVLKLQLCQSDPTQINCGLYEEAKELANAYEDREDAMTASLAVLPITNPAHVIVSKDKKGVWVLDKIYDISGGIVFTRAGYDTLEEKKNLKVILTGN
jgi:hypothetical protein